MDLSRRTLLLGTAGTFFLTACGGGKEEDSSVDLESEATSEGGTTSSTPEVAGGLVLFKAFPPEQPVGTDLRLPLALADADGSFDVDLPKEVQIRLRKPDGGTTPATTVALHTEDLPRGYFPLRTNFDVPGRWGIVLETGTTQVETTVDAKPASEVPSVPGPGDPLPNIPTPTRSAKRGVDPICTADPICPFHTTSLDEALGAGRPIVLMVSTPAFCQVAICGPVLDILVKRADELEAAGVAVIHAEVYVDDRARVTSPTVDALGLTYEPSIFFATPDGTVTERLDSIFDGAEVDAAIAKLVP